MTITQKTLRVLVFANCQGGALWHFLSKLLGSHFDLEYIHIENYHAMHNTNLIFERRDFIQNADLLIYQPLVSEPQGRECQYGIHPDVRALLPLSAKTISVPFIYNYALWPMIEEGGGIKSGNKFFEILQSSDSEEEVVSAYSSGQLEFSFFDRYLKTQSILREKERGCDVVISQYIDLNISEKRLFLTQMHPTSYIFIECARQAYSIAANLFEFRGTPDLVQKLFIGASINAAELPGYFPIDKYSLEFYRFRWCNAPDQNAEQWYRDLIARAYRGLKSLQNSSAAQS